MKESSIETIQRSICEKYNSEFVTSAKGLKVGIARNVRDGILPINGMRHSPSGDTTGWYIYAGEEFYDDLDFFIPLHVEHLCEWCPSVLKFLGLAPGWRFLVADNYEDVWFDEKLVEDL